MKFKADEIASVLQQEIETYQSQIDVRDVGRVLEVGDGIARVYGLSGAMAGELVEFENGVRGNIHTSWLWPETNRRTILRGSLPYVLCMVLAIVLLCIFPSIATFLPDLVMGVGF